MSDLIANVTVGLVLWICAAGFVFLIVGLVALAGFVSSKYLPATKRARAMTPGLDFN